MPKRKPLQNTVEPTTLAEIFAKGPSVFSCPQPEAAFDTWWDKNRNKKLKGKALARAAF